MRHLLWCSLVFGLISSTSSIASKRERDESPDQGSWVEELTLPVLATPSASSFGIIDDVPDAGLKRNNIEALALVLEYEANTKKGPVSRKAKKIFFKSLRERLQESFASKDPAAHFLSGYIYERGFSAEPSFEKAHENYHYAACHGLPVAQYMLGRMYLLSSCKIEVLLDRTNYQYCAYTWLIAAHKNGMIEAAYLLGNFFRYGIWFTQNHTMAAEYFRLVLNSGRQDLARLINVEFLAAARQGTNSTPQTSSSACAREDVTHK